MKRLILIVMLAFAACDDQPKEKAEHLWQDDDYLPPVKMEIITPVKTKRAALPIPLDGRKAPPTPQDGKMPWVAAENARKIYVEAGGR